jgi:hypothetical protein
MSVLSDIRILNEIADEISKYKVPGLPGSLRSLISTKRGENIAKVLEKTAYDLLDVEFRFRAAVEKLQLEINGLRSENQQLTDLVERLGSAGNTYCRKG